MAVFDHTRSILDTVGVDDQNRATAIHYNDLLDLQQRMHVGSIHRVGVSRADAVAFLSPRPP